MSDISKQGIIRLARKAGVKSLSASCIPLMRKLMSEKVEDILKLTIILSENNKYKTTGVEDLVKALEYDGVNLCYNLESI